MKKPSITVTKHLLPFDKLSPDDFERLCLWLVEAEGFLRPSHYGFSGKDSGRDILAYQKTPEGEKVWVFQAKRTSKLTFSMLKGEIDKINAFRDSQLHTMSISGVVFMTPASITASTRDHTIKYASERDLTIDFWAATELDLRVKRYPSILAEFFNISYVQPPPGAPKRISLAEDSNIPLRTFLCHSKRDRDSIRDLYTRLIEDGFDAWFDEESLLPGHDWDQEIRKAVSNAHAIVVCLSKSSVTKAGYVHKEIKYALDAAEEQPEGSIFIIPIRLEECEVPTRLRQWHWLDCYSPNSYEQLVKSLHERKKQLHLLSPTETLQAKRVASIVPKKEQKQYRPSPLILRTQVGEIQIEGKFLRLLEHGAMQRLRAQPQLGFAYLTYPGATSDKFSHALHTFHLMKQLLSSLSEKTDSSKLPGSAFSLGLASAMLNSVLDFPTQEAFTELPGFSWDLMLNKTFVRKWLLLESLDSVLQEDVGICIEDVFDIIVRQPLGPETTEKSIVRSAFGIVGKLITIVESSFSTGIPVAMDHDRLLHYSQIAENPQTGSPIIAWTGKALPSLEQAALSYYHLYQNVFCHKSIRFWTAALKHMCLLLHIQPSENDRFEAQLGSQLAASDTREAIGMLEGQFRARHGVRESPVSGLVVGGREPFRLVFSMKTDKGENISLLLYRMQYLEASEYKMLVWDLCKTFSNMINQEIELGDIVVDLPWWGGDFYRDIYIIDSKGLISVRETSPLFSSFQLERPLRIYMRKTLAEKFQKKRALRDLVTPIRSVIQERYSDTNETWSQPLNKDKTDV